MDMTSRERFIAALNHEEPDRVPIDLGSHYNSCVSAIAYNKLKNHLGIKTPTHVRYLIEMIAAVDLDDGLEVLNAMGGDILPIPRYFVDGFAGTDWKPYTLRDGSECLVPGKFSPVENEEGGQDLVFQGVAQFRMPKNGNYFDRIFSPLSFIENVQQLEDFLPSLKGKRIFSMGEEELAHLEARGKWIHSETGYGILGDPYTFSFYQPGFEFFGYEKFFMFLASDPELVHCWVSFLTERNLAMLDDYLKAVGKYINAIIMGDDYGEQRGPQISSAMFREYFKPYVAKACDRIHETCPHVKILLHTCGSVAPLIPDFIEAGIDALNPVQTTAKNMDPAMLKREFGRHMTFWGGGIGTQTTLHHGTVDDIRKEVKERMAAFKPGGGYVFTPDHNVQSNVPPEKIVAVYEAAKEYGMY